MKSALITGITGQDGSYLAEFLLEKGYEVHGIIRRSSSDNTDRIKHIPIIKHYGDITDYQAIYDIIQSVRPTEVYNLAAQSFVGFSWAQPSNMGQVTAMGGLNVLDACYRVDPSIRFYQASSSEMFGNQPSPQSESTPMTPRSPYGVAKLFVHNMIQVYRESYNMFAVSGILFNHESPRRGGQFVTKKIVETAKLIKMGKLDMLRLGNPDAKRDWGFAGDYVEAMWLMLQQETPQDFVIATGQTHSVKDFVDIVFNRLQIDQSHVQYYDPKYMRPNELNVLLGDASLAKTQLNWTPKHTFEDLVSLMLEL